MFHQHPEKQVAAKKDTPALRVESPKIITSIDATNRKHCKNQKQVHQKQTRANTPITETPVETIYNNCRTSPRTKLPRVELIQWGLKLETLSLLLRVQTRLNHLSSPKKWTTKQSQTSSRMRKRHQFSPHQQQGVRLRKCKILCAPNIKHHMHLLILAKMHCTRY